eukprot:TRINITY_DN10090_c0_g1_i2.p1 TRINITY_DN10090_c0_g1~~TRINITY_DN10090_c0_g1_i2.p1  ORF type:complete len:181 (-),score=40.47 TRINITY_DN10090_c0_g1_i2:552-1094(-)
MLLNWIPLKLRTGVEVTSRMLNLRLTLFNGQVFDWVHFAEGNYYGNSFHSAIVLLRESPTNLIEYARIPPAADPAAAVEYEAKLIDYFNLEENYDLLIDDWIKRDDRFRAVSDRFRGLRIIRQDPFHCLVGFIISQNNNIARISSLIHKLKLNLPFLSCFGEFYKCLRERVQGPRAWIQS